MTGRCLQAASVIGRRFDPQLLALVAHQTNIDDRLGAIVALDLVRLDTRSGDYEFKHALVRDSLYQSLLTEARRSLHLKVAEQIEYRSSNRLGEVAEILAHHYGQTARVDKAFFYDAMAGDKSASMYSLDEATTHLNSAHSLLSNNPECASDSQVADFFVSYTFLLNMSAKWTILIEVLERQLDRLARLGDDPRIILIRHHYVIALIYNTRYQKAAEI